MEGDYDLPSPTRSRPSLFDEDGPPRQGRYVFAPEKRSCIERHASYVALVAICVAIFACVLVGLLAAGKIGSTQSTGKFDMYSVVARTSNCAAFCLPNCSLCDCTSDILCL